MINSDSEGYFDENTEIVAQNACLSIRSNCDPKQCYIINLLERKYYNNLFTKLVEYNMSAEDYPVISYALDEYVSNYIGIDKVKGHYYVGYYFDTLEDEYNIAGILKRTLTQMRFYNPISTLMAVTYSALKITANVYKYLN